MNRVLFIILMCVVAVINCRAQSVEALQGKSGAELKSAISAINRPQTLVSGYVGEGSAWDAFRSTDNDNGNTLDRFSTTRRQFDDKPGLPSMGMTTCCIAPTEWWNEEKSYGDTVLLDLHNLYPCESNVPSKKSDYPPGVVTRAVYNNGVWSSGIGEISGYEVNLWEPADEYKGDFARVVMYMATIYPTDCVAGLGINFMQNNQYPSLNNYAKRLLLLWHHADPVSDLERRRNDAVGLIQGNRNMFVDYPLLADYVWGNSSDEPFGIETKRVQLRSTYRVSEEKIDLFHDSIPDDATWTVDGKAIDADYLVPADLGIGVHELRFLSVTKKGKLKIKIVE